MTTATPQTPRRLVADPNRGHRRRALGATLVCLALLASACGSDDDGKGAKSTATTEGELATGAGVEHGKELVKEGEPKYGGNITVGLNAESNLYDPAQGQFADAGLYPATAMFDSFMQYDDEGGPKCLLCESFTPNEDGSVWTMKLRADKDGKPLVKFHNGEVLDADAAKMHMDLQATKSLAFIVWKNMYDKTVVLDPLTIEIHFKQPWRTFWVNLAGQPGMAMAPEMIDTPSEKRTPIGTGPFMFDEWVRDDHIDVVRNPNYWRTDSEGRKLPYLDGITFKVDIDASSRLTAVLSGDYDFTTTNVPEDIRRMRDEDGYVDIEDLHSEETFIMLNQAGPPFDNADAREAVVLATDRLEIAATIGAGVAVPATSPYAPGTPWEVKDHGYPDFDIEGAKAAAARYEKATGEPLSFEVIALPGPEEVKLMQALEAMWKRAGIKAKITTLEQTAYITQLATGQFEAGWMRNFSVRDPDFNYYFLHSSQANDIGLLSINFTHTRLDELDDALTEARAATTYEARKEATDRSVRALNSELPYVWLFHTPVALIAQDNVHGLNPVRQFGGMGDFSPKWWIGEIWLE